MVWEQDKRTVEDCIQNILAPEDLNGANQYACPKCKVPRDAIRQTLIRKLPKILSLQLMRFSYSFSQERGYAKRKLKHAIRYSQRLKLQEIEYQLCGVLIHRGDEAGAGHYTALAKHAPSGAWFQFNDEIVLPFEGVPDNFDMRNAYTLIYIQQGSQSAYPPVPPSVKAAVDESNRLFDEMIANNALQLKQLRENFESLFKDYQSWINRLFEERFSSSLFGSTEFYLVPSLLLYTVFNAPLSAPHEVDMQPFFCAHGKVSLDKIGGLKLISASCLEWLKQRGWKASPNWISVQNLCETCVSDLCQQIVKRNRHKKRVEEFEAAIIQFKNEPQIYVSKSWLKVSPAS